MTPPRTTTTPPAVTYTLGEWHVRTGGETAFVREWAHFSEWLLEYPGAESLVLIQNEHDSSQFVSLGVWSEGGCTAPWAAFLERLGKCQTLCEAYRGRTYKLAAVPSEAGRAQRVGSAT